MPLVSGTKLGPYEIAEPLGAGGMGEVYRGRDTRLGRDVALKILSEAFASDTERMARFEREAKVLASLNHANIASIYGLEDAQGKILTYITTNPGKSLQAYIGRTISVYGPTMYRPDVRMQYVVASHVAVP